MSINIQPYWLKLLLHFENKGYVHNGLTIPFLIGSLEILDPSVKRWTINEMTKSLSNYGCTILKCGNIGEYIIGSLDDETKKNKQLYHCLCDNILVTDSSLNIISDFNNLVKIFEALYQSRISKKEYSKNYKEWTKFTETDLARIQEIK